MRLINTSVSFNSVIFNWQRVSFFENKRNIEDHEKRQSNNQM